MVHMSMWINDIIKHNQNKIFEHPTVQEFCFLNLYDKAKLEDLNIENLQGEEEILAAKGYKGFPPDKNELAIIDKPENRKISHYKDDKYKLIGICLTSNNSSRAYKYIETFVNEASALELFLVQKFFREFKQNFIGKLKKEVSNVVSTKILRFIHFKDFEQDIDKLLSELSRKDLETIDLIVLCELQDFFSQQAIQRTIFNNLSAKDLMISILENFENAVIKITDPNERYGGKTETPKKTPKTVIIINDEYDVQDILYVVLKSTFPTIKYENPLAKFGAKSTRLDFVLMEEGLIIEVKQIKLTEKNDKKFIDQVKIDLQSYHVLDYLKDIIFFIFAPNAIQDINNFRELEGQQTVQGKTFNVKVIVVR